MKNKAPNKNFIAMISSIGAALEYYDFIIYVSLIQYIGPLFFPNHSSATQIQAFLVFTLAYLARPFGGILLGFCADKIGRRPIFIISLFILALSSFLIGLLPTYAKVGLLASVLLCFLRLLQGVAFSIEAPASIIFLTEHNPIERARQCSWLFAGMGLGASFASFAAFLITSFYTPGELTAFAWRLPFLLGGLLAVVGLILRKYSEETPYFKLINKTKNKNFRKEKLFSNFLAHRGALAYGTLLTFLCSVFILLYLYLPTFLHSFYFFSEPECHLASSLGLLWSVLMLLVLSELVRRFSRESILLVTAGMIAVSSPFWFMLLHLPKFTPLLLFFMIYQTALASLASCYPSLLTELFPTNTRMSGVSFCYSIAHTLSGFTPAFAASLVLFFHTPKAFMMLFPLLGISIFVLTLGRKGTSHLPLPT